MRGQLAKGLANTLRRDRRKVMDSNTDVTGLSTSDARVGWSTWFGAMSLSGVYGSANDEESPKVLREAVNAGCTFWDTSDAYGLGHNESLIGPVLQEHRDKVFICTKFGVSVEEGGMRIRGDREHVLKACDASLERLGVKQIDLYYQHRVDPTTPIEETVKAMKELQDAGKVKYLGLSECSKETLERALKIARIEAIQIEYSPWEIGPEKSGLLDTMKKHGVSLVAYSPLGRGILTGQVKSLDDLAEDDFRRSDPRYQGEAFKLNMRLVDRIKELAEAKGKEIGELVTPAAFCLAWILYQGDNFFVIPGTRSATRLKENLTAGRVLEKFTKEDDAAIRKLISEINVTGPRYSEAMLQLVDL
ncbi:hypothetical protein FRB99_008978 [Tulasnella sp. 403]|nr:hypothetical protein FRB99_008978 [Tulasnella sp. 403]